MSSEDMKLPKDKTAQSCFHFQKCNQMFGCKEENTECDFSPSRYHDIEWAKT